MNHENAFKSALAENRYDHATRLVYADWLDENGREDEANEQRRMATPEWEDADRWMHWFADECGDTGYWGEHKEKITYDWVMEAGRRQVEYGDFTMQFGSEYARDTYYANEDRFWKCWSILANVSPDETILGNPFSCSC